MESIFYMLLSFSQFYITLFMSCFGNRAMFSIASGICLILLFRSYGVSIVYPGLNIQSSPRILGYTRYWSYYRANVNF